MRGLSALTRGHALALLRQGGTGVLGLGLVLVAAAAGLAAGIDIGEPGRLFRNWVIAGLAFLLHAGALLYARESLRTLNGAGFAPVLLGARGDRTAFLWGVFLGQALALLALVAPFLGVLGILEGAGALAALPALLQVALWWLSASMLGALCLVLGQWLGATPTLLAAALLWLGGNGLDEIHRAAEAGSLPLPTAAVQALYYLLPNFSVFDRTVVAANALDWQVGEWLVPGLYGLAYGGALMVIAAWGYRRRSLGEGD